MQDDTALPRNREVLVYLFRFEESVNVLLESLLEGLVQDDVFPIGFLDFSPEVMVLAPKALHHERLASA
jgi:hypothetical protein